MFGSLSAGLWGTSEWGTTLVAPGSIVAFAAVCSGDLDSPISLDAIVGGPDQDETVGLDAVVGGDLDREFALSYSSARVPVNFFGSKDAKPYLLIELALPTGTIRVSSACRNAIGLMWEARLVNAGNILRTIGRGTDSLRIELDDTDTRGPRFRDLFAQDDPEGSLATVWLGVEGAPDSEHVKVFVGKLEAVQGFSYTSVRLQILRREAVEDVLLGALVDEADFPDAPKDSISNTIPVVFGTIEAHEGVVINTNEVGTLRFNIFAADTTIFLVDASLFPVAGTIKIGDEQISYTGKTGNDLTGATRGVGGTFPQDHAKQSEVVETGTFEVKLATHALGMVKRVKLELPNGNLGDPVPQPTIDFATAVLLWDEIPQIRDPDSRPIFQRIGFRDVDAENNAVNPQFAARESIGYDAFKVAQIAPKTFLPSSGKLVLQTNTDGLGQPGDIQRAWLGVLLDPESLPTGGFVTVALRRYIMVPFDVVPDQIARNDERTGDRIYDVPPPLIDVTAPAPVDFSATPQNVVEPGIFVTVQRASIVVDRNDDTFACFSFVGAGESLISGGGDVVCRWTQQAWEAAYPPGTTPGFVEIRALMGTDIVPISSPWTVFMTLDDIEIPGTRLLCQTGSPAGGLTGFIAGVEEFKKTITGTFDPFIGGIPDGSGGTIEAWDRYALVLQPVTGVSAGLWCAHEASIQGQNIPPLPTVSATQDVRQSVTNYFEVTDLIPTVNGSKDWGAFSDLALLGRVLFESSFNTEGRIIETFWVVEFTPFSQATSTTPRTFADVEGLIPGGDPVDIAQAIVTGAPPLGMGLSLDRIDQSSYLAVKASLQADAARADFAVSPQQGALGLLSSLAEQTDCLDTWVDGRHRLIRRVRADVSVPTFLTVRTSDLFRRRQLSFKRSALRRLANRINLRWRFYAPSQDTSAARELDDLPSQAKFGLQEAALILDLLQDETTALLVGTRKLERIKVPRWVVEFDLPLHGIQLRGGDLITLDSRDFSFDVGEVTQVNLDTRNLKKINAQIAVWNK